MVVATGGQAPPSHQRVADLCARAMDALLGSLLTKTPDGSLPERRERHPGRKLSLGEIADLSARVRDQA